MATVEAITNDNIDEHEEINIQTFCYQTLNCPHTSEHLWTGSFFELPVAYFMENITDVDTMACSTQFIVLPHDHSYEKSDRNNDRPQEVTQLVSTTSNWPGQTVLRINSKNSHVGFTQLLYESSGKPFTNRDLRTNIRDKGIGASWPRKLSHKTDGVSKVFEYRTALFEEACMTSRILEKKRFVGDRLSDVEDLTSDWVDTILCPVWPEEANEWRTRKRCHGWPTVDVIRHIVNSGCFFVTKPHEKHSDDTSEWRFSFSRAELVLIHSWNDVQKYIYHILRLIKSEAVKKCGGSDFCYLKTYHFKTLMLWACEERPPEFWKRENIYDSLKELLCTMIEWLIEKECRNYFIPGNNILDYLDCEYNFDSEVQNILALSEKLQQYIYDTAHHHKNKGSKMRISIPNKLFITAQLRCYHAYLLDPTLPGRQRYMTSKALDKTEYFTSKMKHLYKALCAHRLCVSQTIDTNIDEVNEQVLECFKFCREATFDGFTEISYSLSDLFYNIFASILQTPVGHQQGGQASSTSVAEDVGESFLSGLLRHVDDEIENPFYFICCAYEANFHYTTAEYFDRSSIDRLNTALRLCNDSLSYSEQLWNKSISWLAVSSEILPVIITKGWTTLYDRHINAALKKYCRRSSDGSEISDFVVHFTPEDLLRYIRLQCMRKLRMSRDEQGEIARLEDSIDLNPSRLILSEALRLSKTHNYGKQ